MTDQIQPEGYLITSLRLTKEPAGKSYQRILSASRRCLADFTLPFADTGYHLLKRSEETELLKCLTGTFQGFYSEDDIIMLSAPARDEYSEYYYEQAEYHLFEALASELTSVAQRIREGNRITTRTYTEAVRLLNRTEHHLSTEETRAIRAHLEKTHREGVEGIRKKTARQLDNLVLTITYEED